MELQPIIFGVLFLFLLWILFNPPTNGGGGHDAKHGPKDKGGPKKH